MFDKADRILTLVRGALHKYAPGIAVACGISIPCFYLAGWITIDTVNMLGRYLALALVALSLDLVWGYTGMLCLCQSFFFALGGYAMGMYLAHHGGPEGIIDHAGWKIPACLYVVYPYAVGEVPGDALTPWFWKPFYFLPATIALGLFIPAFVASVIGFFVFRSRVRGVFFAVLTQAVTLAAWLVFCMNDMKLCGTNGLTRFDRLAGFPLNDEKTRLGLYVITLAALVLVYWLCWLIIKSRLGRVLVAIRDNETRLRFAGYKPYLFKMFVFSVSAMIAGLGGMLYAPQMGIFTPTNMEVRESILVVVWVAVGGRGTLGGAVAGTLLVNLLYNYLTSRQECMGLVWSPEYWPFVLGSLFIIVVLFCPDGIATIWKRLTDVSKKSAPQSEGTR